MNDELNSAWGELHMLARQRKGSALLLMLAEEARHQRLTLKALGNELRVDAGYLRQLYAGQCDTDYLTREVCFRLARFLGVPVITVLFASGIVTLADFFLGKEAAVKQAAVLTKAKSVDCYWKCLLFTESVEEKLFCAFLAGESQGNIGLSQPSLRQMLEEKGTQM